MTIGTAGRRRPHAEVSMKIDHQTLGTVDVWTPIGALVDDDAERTGADLLARAEGSNPRFVVKMTEVPYMDSAALEVLLTVSEALQSRGIRLKLVAVPPVCRETFEIAGLSHHFHCFETVEDAVRSFL
jgi:anti-anti-sigma factor